MSDTPKTDELAKREFVPDGVWIRHARELERENAALKDCLDWAETILCNSLPMQHSTLDEWNEIINKWRDSKHAIDAARAKEAQL